MAVWTASRWSGYFGGVAVSRCMVNRCQWPLLARTGSIDVGSEYLENRPIRLIFSQPTLGEDRGGVAGYGDASEI
jgi:hypothetical protein